jgi:hypothetical protein
LEPVRDVPEERRAVDVSEDEGADH